MVFIDIILIIIIISLIWTFAGRFVIIGDAGSTFAFIALAFAFIALAFAVPFRRASIKVKIQCNLSITTTC